MTPRRNLSLRFGQVFGSQSGNGLQRLCRRDQRGFLTRKALVILAILLLTGCNAMRDQPKYEPLEENDFFADQRASRPLPAGTIPRSEGLDDPEQYSPRDANGQLVDSFPFEVTLDVLERGREQFDIFCSPCHGRDGYGQGMIVSRGFSPPPSLHDQRLREAPAGYFYEVITNGFGRMYAYNDRIAPHDRWAVVAYIRALQLSQNATVTDVPPDQRQNIQGGNP
jgi:hypothetical protein